MGRGKPRQPLIHGVRQWLLGSITQLRISRTCTEAAGPAPPPCCWEPVPATPRKEGPAPWDPGLRTSSPIQAEAKPQAE